MPEDGEDSYLIVTLPAPNDELKLKYGVFVLPSDVHNRYEAIVEMRKDYISIFN